MSAYKTIYDHLHESCGHQIPFNKKGMHGTKYADLEQILKYVKPALRAADCWWRAWQDEDVYIEVFTLADQSEVVLGRANIKIATDDPQKAGSAFTYGKRYALAGALGLLTGEDDDADTAAGLKGAPQTYESAGELDKALSEQAKEERAQKPEKGAAPACPNCGKGAFYDNRLGRDGQPRPKEASQHFKCQGCNEPVFRLDKDAGWSDNPLFFDIAASVDGPADAPPQHDDDIPF